MHIILHWKMGSKTTGNYNNNKWYKINNWTTILSAKSSFNSTAATRLEESQRWQKVWICMSASSSHSYLFCIEDVHITGIQSLEKYRGIPHLDVRLCTWMCAIAIATIIQMTLASDPLLNLRFWMAWNDIIFQLSRCGNALPWHLLWKSIQTPAHSIVCWMWEWGGYIYDFSDILGSLPIALIAR